MMTTKMDEERRRRRDALVAVWQTMKGGGGGNGGGAGGGDGSVSSLLSALLAAQTNAVQKQIQSLHQQQFIQSMAQSERYIYNFGQVPAVDPTVTGLLRIANALSTFPDPAFSTTYGYRTWNLDLIAGHLVSPIQLTPWHDAELHCETWNESDVVRGVAGIHAHLVPWEWKESAKHVDAAFAGSIPIAGLVERFGRFVLGTEGWRAEWVIIRALHAPSRHVALVLRDIYPEVEVTYTETTK